MQFLHQNISEHDFLIQEICSKVAESTYLEHSGLVDCPYRSNEQQRGMEELFLGDERLKLIWDAFQMFTKEKVPCETKPFSTTKTDTAHIASSNFIMPFKVSCLEYSAPKSDLFPVKALFASSSFPLALATSP